MSLSDIAEGVATTESQRDRGVAVVDRTDTSLADALAPFADALPCEPAAAATVVREYADGSSVGDAAVPAGVAPMTASKTLHRLGFEGLSPFSPLEREICRDWLDAELTRSEARSLIDAGETGFALGAYIETHEPIPEAADLVQDALSTDADAMVEKRDALADTMTASRDLLG
jgi:hypothetical protein